MSDSISIGVRFDGGPKCHSERPPTPQLTWVLPSPCSAAGASAENTRMTMLGLWIVDECSCARTWSSTPWLASAYSGAHSSRLSKCRCSPRRERSSASEPSSSV